MVGVVVREDFRMTRLNYWLFVILLTFGCFVSGAAGAVDFGTLLGWFGMWVLGFWRLRDAGCRHVWPGIFAPLVIGLIWIGCIGDRTGKTDD